MSTRFHTDTTATTTSPLLLRHVPLQECYRIIEKQLYSLIFLGKM
jgi:hypothetical protein